MQGYLNIKYQFNFKNLYFSLIYLRILKIQFKNNLHLKIDKLPHKEKKTNKFFPKFNVNIPFTLNCIKN